MSCYSFDWNRYLSMPPVDTVAQEVIPQHKGHVFLKLAPSKAEPHPAHPIIQKEVLGSTSAEAIMSVLEISNN